MAKKNVKNSKKETVELKENIKTPNTSVEFIRVEEDNDINTTLTEYDINKITFISKKPLELMDITQLVALEKACSLLCKRFETIARLDTKNNIKFKEFKNYYEMIFSELEKRVLNICKE